MKKIIPILIISLLFSIKTIFSQSNIEISLLTCSSGEETFTAWGHSALRIVDKNSSTDIVYNFGLFDFDTPNFYLKFIKGKLKYKLGAHYSQGFYESYLDENRQIIEQKLNLSDESKTKIINRLEYLYRPENRYYYYSFVGKNCTTELRDLLLNNVETDFQNQITNKTYRKQLNEFLNDKLWVKLGMSLIMGYKIDRKVNRFESMFLPDYLCNQLNSIKINGESLVLEEKVYNKVEIPKIQYPLFLNPLFIFTILMFIVFFLKSNYLQNSLLFVTGLLGLTILLVSLITEHKELNYNFNVLWINPVYLIMLVLDFRKKLDINARLGVLMQSTIIIMFFIWIFKVQDWDYAFIPIAVILSIINYRIITKSRLKFGKQK